jgi:hypothetical protein
MKKGLLMTSALVAAGMLTIGNDAQAQTKPTNPVQLRVGGYMTHLFGFALNRQDAHQRGSALSGGVAAADASPNTFDQQTEAEVHFIGDGRLDNGLVIRAVAELELSGSPGQVWDEQYLILRNGYGQLILGAEDPVAELMTAGYGNGLLTYAGENLTYGSQNWVPSPVSFSSSPTNSAARSAFIESPDNNDANKVIYVSPRFFGFQAGISYAPEQRNQLDEGDGAGGGGTTDAGKRLPLKDLMHDIWSLGLNYDSLQIGDAKFGFGAGYIRAAYPHLRWGGGASGTSPSLSNAKMWGIGGRMDLGGWRATVGYKSAMNIEAPPGSAAAGGTTLLQSGGGAVGSAGSSALLSTLTCSGAGTGNCSADGYGINAGVMYSWGPHAVSLNGRYGTEAGQKAANETNSDKVTGAILSYARNLAPGVKVTANWIYASYNDESQTDIDFNGHALVGTVNLNF